jgi:hypothetical protein
MRKLLGLIAALAISITAAPAHAADKRIQTFAGKYDVTVGSVGSNPSTSVIYTSPSDKLGTWITISKSGSISGKWGRMYTTQELLRNIEANAESGSGSSATQYDVTLKGKITKISSTRFFTTASFTFTLSDGAKGSGTIKLYAVAGRFGFPGFKSFSLNGKLRLAGEAGSLLGSK